MPAAFNPTETRHMRQLLRLAISGENPWPNPYTAAAVIRDGEILGIGHHPKAGAPHAEVLALRDAGEAARGATLMVTLEPCTHWGRTPPCVAAIVQAGIREVIYAVSDPNPKVRANGAKSLLEAQGIRVRTGLCDYEALVCNAPFMKRMATEMPFVTAKIATSLDGKTALANGESTYITGPKSRAYVHRLRATHDVIITGIGTVLADNPRLTVRDRPMAASPPLLILDTHGRTPLTARLFEERSPEQVIIVVGAEVQTAMLSQKATVLRLPEGPRSWPHVLRICQERGWYRVLIEAGEHVVTSALDADVVDKVVWCMAPILLGGHQSFMAYGGPGVQSIAHARSLITPKVRRMGTDILIEGFLHPPETWIKERS
jgi:diaminohydroxyphosphoribosylaminopyrimidine deaminase/5-amino-6-(5-phosphoribosylamino)uracil reductase